ncbi:ABC transporter permease [Pinirhizobacter soli]|uniref:ABC transporter permease n=1 Tax=Pinirhizobacter soli TaxID=2786953 RepID=UPI00202A71C7|nr:FtsX-like permease family protein [Pinirhizobacter soli]
MQIAPILAALKRSKTGAVLVVLQVALTLAITSNILSIVQARVALVMRSTGVDTENVFALGFRLDAGAITRASRDADLAAVRAVPGVVDAVAANSYPLRGTGWVDGVSLTPGVKSIQEQNASAAFYAMDEHAIPALGLALVEGSNFNGNDSLEGNFNAGPMPNVAILSEALARHLFPGASALGKVLYVSSDASRPVTVVGVVKALQTPMAAGTIDPAISDYSVMVPIHGGGSLGLYLVRVQPGRMDITMGKVRQALSAVEPARSFGKLKPFADVRDAAYRKDRSLAIALSVVCLALVLVTVLGIVGLTSFWVSRRKRQIGVRRALGATGGAIARYFLLENALLCTFGVLLGVVVAEALNAWLATHYGVSHLPAWQLLASIVIVLLIGQLAAATPAWRASRLPPTEALRAV